jgi:type IV pilus assembly protein PilY1
MNTYTVSLGYFSDSNTNDVAGGPNPTTPCIADNPSMAVGWLQPWGVLGLEATSDPAQGDSGKTVGGHAKAAIDDLKHAALNGRGNFLSAFSPMALTRTLPEILAEMNEPACTADVAVNGMGVTADSKVFQASYQTKDWSGEVSAYSLEITTGQEVPSLGSSLWSASRMLPGGSSGTWDQRRIVTYGGPWMQPQGVPFRYDQLSTGQRSALGSDLVPNSAADDKAKDLVDFLRGRSFPKYRARETLLGDIVHSTPVLFGGTLFVGANDGMLHAFNAATGEERFSYVPNLIYDHLSALADHLYAYQHRYFVDGPLYAGEVMVGEYQRNAYLVGGLGKGGKGYFCLLVGQRERSPDNQTYGDYHWNFHVDDLDSGSSEGDVGELIQWEYPRPDPSNDWMDNDGDGFLDEAGEIDPNLGYSFGQAYAVNANCVEGTYRPVVIFGNGYDSENRKAVLYVLAADSGQIVRIIDTGAAGDNGLSTPALIDVDLDRRVDYAYAGDLKGNLWKFDLTAADPRRWGVAYGVDMDGDGVIDAAHGDLPAPLFQAPGQPISGRPDVMVMHGSCLPQAPGCMVFFGTGRYLGVTDRADVTQQSLFAIWDYGDDSDDSEHLGRLTDRDSGQLSSGLTLYKKQLVSEANQDGAAYRQLSADDIDYALVEDKVDADGYAVNNTSETQKKNPKHYAGWFFDFPLPVDASIASGERVIGNAAIRGGKVIVPSYIPDNRPCSGGGRSWLNILTACNGDPPLDSRNEPIHSRGYQGKTNDRPVVVKDLLEPRQDVILFMDHTGRLLTLKMEGENWGKVYWRQGR